MVKNYTVVRCRRDLGKEKHFYFHSDPEIAIAPNYCEDFNKSKECAECAATALRQLIDEARGQTSTSE